MDREPRAKKTATTDLFEQCFQRILFSGLDHDMFFIDVFDDKVESVFRVDLDEDGFDGRVAFDEDAVWVVSNDSDYGTARQVVGRAGELR